MDQFSVNRNTGLSITDCLLDAHSTAPAGELTVGTRIAQQGHAHLWGSRTRGDIDTIVVHYTSAEACPDTDAFSREAILSLFCAYAVSSHYLIERDGNVLRLVPQQYTAWHAGGSIMPPPDNRRAVNGFSIGIELVATHTSGFTAHQYAALIALCTAIIEHYGRRFSFVGHEDVAGQRAVECGLRNDVKHDPGPGFEWRRLSEVFSTHTFLHG
jgi:N-acetyl-anhydromuramyl-L-alanine amidase AmpD